MTGLIARIRQAFSPDPDAALEAAIEHYVSAPERLERLARLRRSVMASWEGALEWGEGNHLSGVYAPMMVGLVDVAAAAQRLAEAPTDSVARRDLERHLTDYLHDLEAARLRGSEGADDAALAAREAERRRKSLASALFARYGNVQVDQPPVRVPDGPTTGHRPYEHWLGDADDVLAYMARFPNG